MSGSGRPRGGDASPADVAERLRTVLSKPRFPAAFAEVVLADDAMRTRFPADPRPILARVARAVVHVLDRAEPTADRIVVSASTAFLADIGAEHAKLGIGRGHVDAFAAALGETLRRRTGDRWTPRFAAVTDALLADIADAVAAGLAAAPQPATVGARVVQVLRPVRDVAVVRLVADRVIDYHPGQHLSVRTPYAAGHWRPLSPAIPSNPARQIEFHVRAVPGGDTSGPLVTAAAPGDRWVLASPLGALEVDPADRRDVLMIADGVGIAPLKALVHDMLRHPDNPRVHLFYGGDFPGELYALGELVGFATTSPWLTIQPVVSRREDPWWVEPTSDEISHLVHRPLVGSLADIVPSFGGWGDRRVLAAGRRDVVRAVADGLVARGGDRGSMTLEGY